MCSARQISFEIILKTTDFKRNPSGRTRIYEYTHIYEYEYIHIIQTQMKDIQIPNLNSVTSIFVSPCSRHFHAPCKLLWQVFFIEFQYKSMGKTQSGMIKMFILQDRNTFSLFCILNLKDKLQVPVLVIKDIC